MQVEKTKNSVNELISYLGKKMLRYTVLPEMGVYVTFLYEVLWLELFIPWGNITLQLILMDTLK